MLGPGDQVGRYTIQAIVGEGGFGKVYRAWDPELQRPVAIKELSNERQADEPTKYAEYRERFRMERRVQGQFQHPHIVSVYDLVQQDGNEYLVEQLVDGGTLRSMLDREGRLSPQRVIGIGLEMCQAIAAMWECDIVHRDIKPSNILLTGEGQALLGDFGIAQVGRMSQRTQGDTRHPGTPAYMSPEQEKGTGYLDERSDLYALALVLYEALSGKSYKRERVPVRQLAPDVPKGLEIAMTRALAQDPGDRYSSVAEFETALRHAMDKSRPAWIGWGSAFLLLVLAIGGWQLSRAGLWKQDAPTPTVTSVPSQLPAVNSPTSTASLAGPVPTLSDTPTPNATSTLTPTAVLSLSPTVVQVSPTRTPIAAISAPRLAIPSGAAWTCLSHQTFKWNGRLPNPDYGFRVSLRNGERDLSYTSPILDSTQWTLDIPGSAVGEWRWSVAVVRRDGAQDRETRSEEWTFYYTPLCSSISSLATPTRSP